VELLAPLHDFFSQQTGLNEYKEIGKRESMFQIFSFLMYQKYSQVSVHPGNLEGPDNLDP
jgi:hypothetical protein